MTVLSCGSEATGESLAALIAEISLIEDQVDDQFRGPVTPWGVGDYWDRRAIEAKWLADLDFLFGKLHDLEDRVATLICKNGQTKIELQGLLKRAISETDSHIRIRKIYISLLPHEFGDDIQLQHLVRDIRQDTSHKSIKAGGYLFEADLKGKRLC